ncbi:MAG: adenine phosphoribosyltransferase [Chloroflexi bacterium]|nr:adenine phosphoribosyltransferase [Chloroflexota bacterium]|tara:strand:+ start:4684 stop:5205 length:522 start_codon:yes stop_codon:yes gene_type:complete
MNIKSYITDIMDFPSDGIIFRDISPLIGNYEALNYVLDSFEKYALTLDFDCIAAIDARGFIFGAPIANRLKVPFVPIRKSGKLPPPLKSIKYDLEYGNSSLECKDDILKNNKKVILIDDLLATGGTINAAIELISSTGAAVVSALLVVELLYLNGRNNLPKNIDVNCLVNYEK